MIESSSNPEFYKQYKMSNVLERVLPSFTFKSNKVANISQKKSILTTSVTDLPANFENKPEKLQEMKLATLV